MVAAGEVEKAKASPRGGKALRSKMKAPRRALAKKSGKPGGKKGSKKGKGKKRGRRKKKGPRCPIKRRKRALKRKCYSMTDMRALINTYYAMHGVVQMLKFRKFKWKKKKKPT